MCIMTESHQIQDSRLDTMSTWKPPKQENGPTPVWRSTCSTAMVPSRDLRHSAPPAPKTNLRSNTTSESRRLSSSDVSTVGLIKGWMKIWGLTSKQPNGLRFLMECSGWGRGPGSFLPLSAQSCDSVWSQFMIGLFVSSFFSLSLSLSLLLISLQPLLLSYQWIMTLPLMSKYLVTLCHYAHENLIAELNHFIATLCACNVP